MNEKEFLKLMNSKKYRNNERLYFAILGLLKYDEQHDIILYKPSFFQNILKGILPKKKTANQIIIDNFDLILRNLSCYGSNPQIIKILLKREELRTFLEQNFNKILKIVYRDVNKGSEESDGYLQYNTKNLLQDFIGEDQSGSNFIVEHAEQIIEHTNIKELFNVIQLFKGKNPTTDEFLNQILEQNKVEIARILILDSISSRETSFNEEPLERCSRDYAVTFSIMIDELLQSEGKRWIDINTKIGGSFSDVFEIGNKILKIGQPRKTYKIPYNRRILQPLVRTNFDIDRQDIACVEICEKVDVKFECNEQETIYEIYKDLREQGIVWTDPKIANVGRLKSDNVVILNGEVMEVDLASIGVEGETQEVPLKKGDFVILDTDYIFREDDPELFWGNEFNGEKLEKRYQQEKQEEIAKRFREDIKLKRTEQTMLKETGRFDEQK